MPKKMTEKEHREYQAKRAKSNKELMKIQIPKRTRGKINPDFWYIIYEEQLLKPKVLDRAFKEKSMARHYRKTYMPEYKVNILPGSKLLEYGYEEHLKNYRRATGEARKEKGTQYSFHPELSAQRRKTLRTMYRRNYRRLMQRLMNG